MNLLRTARRELDAVLSIGLAATALLLYLRTLAPTVVAIYDDSLEFPLVVHRLAIAHPTGYPLYTLVGKLFSFLPVGDVAFRLHLFSAVCAAGAVGCLYLLARRIGMQPLAGVGATLCLAVSPVFWSQALIAEVYALHALFVAVILLLAAAAEDQPLPFSRVAALAFVSGLGLTHHRTTFLILPAIALYLLLAQGRHGSRPAWPRWWPLILLVLFCLPLSLYLYIPLRGAVISSLDGAYRNAPDVFLDWVLGRSYTIFLRDNPLKQDAIDVPAYGRLVLQQVGKLGVVFALVGAAWLAVRRWRVVVLLGLVWLAVVAFVAVYRVADAPVFLIPSFMVVAVLVGAGVDAIAGTWPTSASSATLAPEQGVGGTPRRWGYPPHLVAGVRMTLAAAVVVAIPASVLAANVRQLDRSHDWAVHNYAVDVLSQPLEPGAAIVGILGEMTLLRYVQETAGVRPDIETVAADTDAARVAAIERLLNEGRPVYLTRPLAMDTQELALRAVGPLTRVQRPPMGPVPIEQGSTALRVVYGERVILLGYRYVGLGSDLRQRTFGDKETLGSVESGGRLRLTLYWQALQPLPRDYHVTVRLISPAGRLLWQTDGRPVHGGYATTAWHVGDVIADVYDLLVPVGTPPGLYDLEVGLYDAETLALLPVAGRSSLLTIGPVAVHRPQHPVNLDVLPRKSLSAASGLTIPGGRLDYSLERLGVQHIVGANVQNEFTLYGYGLSATPLVPGQRVDVTLLWRAERAPASGRVVFLRLADDKGTVWLSHESQPGDATYPTEQWQWGEVIRDVHTLLVPADIPDGFYRLEAGMYDPTGEPLPVIRLTRRSLDRVDLGRVRVQGRPHSQQLPSSLQHTVNARLGNVATLVGYDAWVDTADTGIGSGIAVLRPGQTLRLRFVWKAMEPTRTSYTVFVHLVGPDGRVVSQDDAIPGRGTLPTPSWVRGEVLLDEYALSVPGEAAVGSYQVVMGLYDAATGSRLPVWDGNGVAVGDSFILMKVQVERAP